MMPLSYSIATGIACGFIFYPITMLITKTQRSTSNYVFLNGTIYFIFRICIGYKEKDDALLRDIVLFTIYLNDHLCTEYK